MPPHKLDTFCCVCLGPFTILMACLPSVRNICKFCLFVCVYTGECLDASCYHQQFRPLLKTFLELLITNLLLKGGKWEDGRKVGRSMGVGGERGW